MADVSGDAKQVSPGDDRNFTAQSSWLALMIGNSRLHWALFEDDRLQQTWDMPHPTEAPTLNAHQLWELPLALLHTKPGLELWIASVVPSQTELWKVYPSIRLIGLEQVPLQSAYSTLGIDRALAVWGAIATIGAPVLVIDAGTALTFTAADGNHALAGGAILPGLRLQFQSLHQRTAALPELPLPETLSPRWANDTPGAIASGILHTVLAGIRSFVEDWQQQHSDSAIVLTGGDSDRLYGYFQAQSPEFADCLTVDPHLIFWGIREIRGRTAG